MTMQEVIVKEAVEVAPNRRVVSTSRGTRVDGALTANLLDSRGS